MLHPEDFKRIASEIALTLFGFITFILVYCAGGA
tara:strand:- start:372 stop:473 length:102 start_codon:yes stop_codon:yes gene_type:complete